MKIAVCSDLHLEFGPISLENTDNAEVLILSGDICVAKDLGENDSNNIKGEKSAVQIKYRKDPTYYLTAGYDNLDSMSTEAMHEGVVFGEKIPRHYIFTSAKGLNHKTSDYKFRDKVKCYGIDDIKSIIDNNPNFWNNIVNLIKK